MKGDPQPFETDDVNLAAFLVSRGHRLQGITSAGGQKKLFVFPAEAEAGLSAWMGDDPVPGRTLLANREMLLKAIKRDPYPNPTETPRHDPFRR